MGSKKADFLCRCSHCAFFSGSFFNNLPKAFNDIRTSDVDLIFNVCERINNSSLLEPHAASILDTLQIPYTGSNPFTLALCIDKIRVKKIRVRSREVIALQKFK